jgi:GTPase
MSTKIVPIVAIVGRTNVGKSTLFNSLIGKRKSVVEDYPGVTRDRIYHEVYTDNLIYRLVDTGGLVGEDENPLQTSVREQAQIAIAESSLLLVLFDGQAGPSVLDEEVVRFIQRSNKSVIWIANKCEKPAVGRSAIDFYSLGIDNIVTISAEHNLGLGELKAQIVDTLLSQEGSSRYRSMDSKDEMDGEEENPEDSIIKVSIIGRPNVGKSTLLNKILGEDRAVTSDVPGTTRDSLDVEITRDGRKIQFIDTAGLRRKSKVEDQGVERYGNLRSLKALVQSDVAILVLDGNGDLGSLQDSRLAGLADDRGRGLIIVVNKWDVVEKDHTTVKAYKDYIAEHFKFARYAPTLFVSALTGKRCPSIIDEVFKVYDAARIRIPTAQVNKTMIAAFEKKTAPIYRGAPIKLYFASQIGITPPTFVLFVNYPKKINFGYARYLKNIFRKEFGFYGVGIKIYFRKRRSKNDGDEE